MLLSGRAVAVVVVAFVALLVGYTLYALSAVPGTVTSPVPASFTVNGRTYTFTYIATTPQERQEGLMNTRITNTTTELFAFPQPVAQPFWMYQTNASLDMIWIMANGDNGTVVYLVTSAQPCFDSSICTVYRPDAPANYVIEAKAGFAAANGIAVGTAVHFG
ncbi:MAG: DUF192 domain-containing protein [Nitrososphaerota archaeon]|nr:DUF192 domain-containing protein [Nitrososphaerota archaeon]MDG7024829.1 DUF192 domain-containing protein [Nitrososphaerota archaeon]